MCSVASKIESKVKLRSAIFPSRAQIVFDIASVNLRGKKKGLFLNFKTKHI